MAEIISLASRQRNQLRYAREKLAKGEILSGNDANYIQDLIADEFVRKSDNEKKYEQRRLRNIK